MGLRKHLSLFLFHSDPPMGRIVSRGTVFVSHSRRDSITKQAVEKGLAKCGLKPFYFERRIVPHRSTKEINDRIKAARGFFVFFTPFSTREVTRDWVSFEIGLAAAHERDIYSWWKEESVARDKLPVFLWQLSSPRDYSTKTPADIARLERQVEIAGKQLLRSMAR